MAGPQTMRADGVLGAGLASPISVGGKNLSAG